MTRKCLPLLQIRSRACDSPAPSLGGESCRGSAVQRKTCEGHSCPVDGGWAEWGAYGFCTNDCESGVKIRRGALLLVPLFN